MATEQDRQEERERLGNDPLRAPEPGDEQLEQEDEESGDPKSGEPSDLDLLASQLQKPGLQTSETIVLDPSQAPYTISGRDEESQPDRPGAVPPGETM